MSTPAITITDATPPKSAFTTYQNHATPTSISSTYRLLYRGSISLPDSYLLLDGLTFAARLGHGKLGAPGSGSGAMDLLENPLALALESMRGRPSLRFKGTVRLTDVWMDNVGDVCMDIHHLATLSKVYFENILGLSRITPLTQRTEVGVRVALGDTDGLETTEIIIYGAVADHFSPLLPLASTSHSPPLEIRVGRVTHVPPTRTNTLRPPRPDDPTPRKPPIATRPRISASLGGGAGKHLTFDARGGKGAKAEEEDIVRRAREVMLHMPKSLPARGKAGSFKVPALPVKVKGKGKERADDFEDVQMDVFGAVETSNVTMESSSRKGKGKVGEGPHVVNTENGDASSAKVEQQNRSIIKKITVRALADIGISTNDADFKELYGYIYRGTAFALRDDMGASLLSQRAVEALVEAHAKLYVGDYDTRRNQKGKGKASAPAR
ncbi:hypothetical protein CONPUDRAFT_166014 [Coniophora puteana RWD-64-598 SS2]|uniref:Sld7 C-terminal domain-containing protein n=1 Tax=Coniophora puteana (strain RWD-64-598) TaxID=741705 RepID=A0A5M3MN80_CONPW|nr:uncharacterized protein CONPUDRAFT_166014 [Coniophora puteana RWD-64-598 SS2]EIW80507.1 hypothetical protein CONPUDRAFT_166014 [Coniophora puteana RWD-64-598 SS2]